MDLKPAQSILTPALAKYKERWGRFEIPTLVSFIMKVESLRSSSIGSYNNCPFNFYLNYIVGIPSIANKKADRGTATHWVLEQVAEATKAGKAHLKKNKPEKLLKQFFKEFGKKFDFHDEDFDECLNHLKTVERSEFWPAKLRIVQTEQQFQFEVHKDGFETDAGKPVLLRGTIDLLTEYSCEKTGKKVLRIIDWKTGRRTDWKTGAVKDLAALHKDIQLRLYHLISTKIYPGYDSYEVVIFFITDGGPFLITFGPDDVEKTLDQLRRIFKTIKADQKLQRLKDDQARKDEKWKCVYVCQFGKVQRTYISDDGEMITDEFKYDKRGNYPTILLDDNGKDFHYVEGSDTTLCDRYYSVVKRQGPETAAKIIHNITIKGKPLDLSARNDYNAEGIFKGIIS